MSGIGLGQSGRRGCTIDGWFCIFSARRFGCVSIISLHFGAEWRCVYRKVLERFADSPLDWKGVDWRSDIRRAAISRYVLLIFGCMS